MSITDELREYAHDCCARIDDDIHAIADRIDERHKHAIGYVDDRDPETMAEHGWIRLPKEADGEYIRVGDELIDEDDKLQKPAIVKCILYNDEGCVVSDIDPRGCWYDPSLLRHYHAPTVEDVLTEFFEEVGDGLHTLEAIDTQVIIAEYAAKLQLKEDA